MTAFGTIDPIQAALELERRGRPLPSQIRAKLDALRQSGQLPTPGIQTSGTTVRGPGGAFSLPRGASPSREMFGQPPALGPPQAQSAGRMGPVAAVVARPPEGVQQAPRPADPLVQSRPLPPSGPSVREEFGYDVPVLRQAGPNAVSQDEQLAQIMQQQKRAGAPAYMNMGGPQQLQTAQQILAMRQSEGTQQYETNIEDLAARAAARWEAVRTGQYKYSSPQEAEEDRKVLRSWSEQRQQRNVRAQAAQLADIGSFPIPFAPEGQRFSPATALGTAANALTFGGSAALRTGVENLRGVPDPMQTQGLEAALAAESPGGAAFGTIAGMGVPVAAGSQLAARAGRLGVAALGGGRVLQGAGAAAGGLVAGEAIGGLNVAGTTLSQTGDIGQSAQAGIAATMQYPVIAQKLANGEPLDGEDIQALIFLPLEALGIAGDFVEAARAAKLNRPLRQSSAEALSRVLNEMSDSAAPVKTSLTPADPKVTVAPEIEDDVRVTPNSQFDADAFAQGQRTLETQAMGQAARAEAQELAPAALGGDFQARQQAANKIRQATGYEQQVAESLPGVPVAAGRDPSSGLPYQVEELRDGRFRAVTYDTRGSPIAQHVTATVDEAIMAAEGTLVPSERGPADLALDQRFKDPRSSGRIEDRRAEPGPAKVGEREVTPDEVIGLGAKLNAAERAGTTPEAEADTIRGAIENIDSRGGNYVMMDLPTEGDYTIPGKPRVMQVKKYKGMDPATQPPIIAGPMEGGKVLIADGKTRLAAARARGDKTIRALVPKWYRDSLKETPSGQVEAREAAPPPPRVQSAAEAGPKVDVPVEASKGEQEGVLTPKDPDQMTVRELRAEAKALGVTQHDNTPGQPKLRERVRAARARSPEPPKEAKSEPPPAEPAKEPPPPEPVREEAPPPKPEPEPEPPPEAAPPAAPRADPIDGVTRVAEEAIASGKPKWSETSDAALMRIVQLAPEGSPLRAQAEIQLKSRTNLPQNPTDQDVFRAIYDQEVRDTTDRGELSRAVSEWPDEAVEYMATKKKAGPVAAVIRREALKRGIKIPEKPRQSSEAMSPVAAAVRTRAAAANQGRALTSKDSPHRIISDLNEKIGMGPVGIMGSRGLKKKYLGLYRPRPEATRLRLASDMDTHAHEAGHHLHKVVMQGGRHSGGLGLDPGVFPASWRPELDKMGKALYGSTIPNGGYATEGFAELMRLMMTDQVAAAREAPIAYHELVQRLEQFFPEIYRPLLNFRHRYQLYTISSPASKLSGYINRRSSRRIDLLKAWDRFRVLIDDRTQPAMRLMKDVGITKNTPADQNPHVLALRVNGRISGDMKRAMQYGRWDVKTGQPIKGSKGIEKILSPVRDNLPEFEDYLVAVRALEKRSQGHRGVLAGLSNKEIDQAAVQLETQFPAFKAAAKEFQEFNEWLIRDYAVGHGLIEKKAADRIISKNLHYVTFRKVAAQGPEEVRLAGRGRQRFVDTGTGVRRFAKFSGEQIDPPLEAFMDSMNGVFARAQMNRVGQSIVNLFDNVDGMGRWIDRIDQPIEAFKANSAEVLEQIKKRLVEAGIDPDTTDGWDDLANLITDDDFLFFRPGLRTDKASRQFIVLKNGKPTFWEAKNNMLFDFLEGLGHHAVAEGLLKLMTIPRIVLRSGATALNPAFGVINFFRDAVQAMVNSEAGAAPGIRAKAWIKAFATGDVNEMYLASGADLSGLFGEYVDPSTKRFSPQKMFGRPHEIKALVKERRYAKAVARIAASPFYGLDRINGRFELSNRLAEFEAVLHQQSGGQTPTRAQLEYAGQAAADVTLDFQRGGTLGMQANLLIPFFNAPIQGVSKLARYIRKNPAKAMGRIFAYVVAPSIAAHMMNRKNREYWKIPYRERDRYWHIPLGDPDFDGAQEWLRIPKPYGLGVFGTAVERMMAAFDGIDPITGKTGDPRALKDLKKLNPVPFAGDNIYQNPLFTDFRPPYTVPLVLPLFELSANHSIHFGGPIVHKSEQSGPVSERGAERSSQLAYTLGKIMNVEPPKIDYAIQGLMGGLGTDVNEYALGHIVKAGREITGSDPKPERKVGAPLQPEEWAIVKRLLLEEPRAYSETLIRFWETWEQLENSYRGFTALKEQPEQAGRYAQKNIAEIAAYKNIQPFKSAMDDAFKEIRRSYRTYDLPDKERHQLQRRLFDHVDEIARNAMMTYDKLPKGDR